ncbi:MAG: excisionase [Schaedlerella sp.]|nr:excisionase [Schaedlerella sp.]
MSFLLYCKHKNKGGRFNEQDSRKKEKQVPIWCKITLSIEEAAEYSGIGRDRLRSLTEDENCDFVVWVGKKRIIKREKFEAYLINSYSI